MFKDPKATKGPIYFIGAIAVVSLIGAWVGMARQDQPGRMGGTEPSVVRNLVFEELADNRISVSDAITDEQVALIEEEGDGLLRGAYRAINRSRSLDQMSPEEPFQLVLWENGRVTLSDMSLDKHFYLDSFGRTEADGLLALLSIKDNGVTDEPADPMASGTE